MGVVTRVTTGPLATCRSAIGVACEWRTLTLAWHFTIVGFTGTLPNIHSLRIRTNLVKLLFAIGGPLFAPESSECLYTGDLEGVANVGGEPGRFETITLLRELIILELVRLRDEFFRPCPQ